MKFTPIITKYKYNRLNNAWYNYIQIIAVLKDEIGRNYGTLYCNRAIRESIKLIEWKFEPVPLGRQEMRKKLKRSRLMVVIESQLRPNQRSCKPFVNIPFPECSWSQGRYLNCKTGSEEMQLDSTKEDQHLLAK